MKVMVYSKNDGDSKCLHAYECSEAYTLDINDFDISMVGGEENILANNFLVEDFVGKACLVFVLLNGQKLFIPCGNVAMANQILKEQFKSDNTVVAVKNLIV